MGLLSCVLVNSTDTPGALAGAALIASEALRGTSSAALLCMILAIEYNTVLSFSKCVLPERLNPCLVRCRCRQCMLTEFLVSMQICPSQIPARQGLERVATASRICVAPALAHWRRVVSVCLDCGCDWRCQECVFVRLRLRTLLLCSFTLITRI